MNSTDDYSLIDIATLSIYQIKTMVTFSKMTNVRPKVFEAKMGFFR